jgi:hypothetical protein
MASAFKSKAAVLGTVNSSAATIYTCPAGTKAVIHAVYISNTNESLDINASITITVDAVSYFYYLGKDLSVLPGNTLVLDKPINMQQNDRLRVWCDVSGGNVFLSILEIT